MNFLRNHPSAEHRDFLRCSTFTGGMYFRSSCRMLRRLYFGSHVQSRMPVLSAEPAPQMKQPLS
jgi:hypothetical protein